MHVPSDMERTDQVVTMQLYNTTTNITNGTDVIFLGLKGATIASPIIMFLCGVIGNLLALVILHRTRLESQRLMFHSLVAGLVWNDLSGIILTSPVTIASYINDLQMPGGEHLCRFNGFIMVCFGLSTPLIVSAMAIERFLFVKYTFFYTKHCAPGAARLLMLVIWGFVLFFGLLPMFGFGNYVLQYPRTWCFLDFRTTNPVHAAYGYLYSSLNLLLVIVMVVCNLVVVVTLARVRDYRRKYSTSSLNSVLIGDGVMDDTQRQQAMARRRKQKDIELQMIVVMCAITTIFAVCWVPLMMYITLTLATEGQTADVLGLVAIRLASLNQTLNPWLYVILRRALIIRIKKYCCRWRRYFRRKSNLSPTPVMRRQQYVHVRNQLCHRNNFVGGEMNNESISDSVRKSIQQAIPVAMSLPDVMMVNTGRGHLEFPLPDVAKAESFAGRVSHSHSSNSLISCAYCNSPAVAGCVDCLTERYAAARMASKQQLGKPRKNILNEEYPLCPNNSKISEDLPEIQIIRDQILFNKDENIFDTTNSKPDKKDRFNSKQGSGNHLEISNISRDALVCTKHSSHSQHFHKDQNSSSEAKSGNSQKKKDKELISMTSTTPHGSSIRGRSHDSHLSQHMHRTRNSSKSSSTKTSSSKGHPGSRQSHSGDGQPHVNQASERNHVGAESVRSNPSHEHDHKMALNESADSDNVFPDSNDVTCVETHKDMTTTTDDNGFSSLQTDSMCLSDVSTVHQCVHNLKVIPEQPPNNSHENSSTSNHNHIDLTDNNHLDKDQEHFQNTRQNGLDSTQNNASKHDRTPAHKLQPPQTNLPKLISSVSARSSYTNPAYNINTSESSSCLIKENSDDESERSSGIFSADSPARSSKDMGSKLKFDIKNESQSEPVQDVKSGKKQTARRVKSYN